MSEILCDVNYRAIERDLLARSNSRTLVLPDSTKERCVSAVGRQCNRVFLHPIVEFECEYEREKRGDWSRIARGKNECSKFCGWKPLWTGKALLREGEFSKWWRRDWKRRDWSVIPIFILLGASRARGAIWESMNISYSLDSVYI